MLADKLRGKITADRRLEVELPNDIQTGAVEVILLFPSPQPRQSKQTRRKGHPAFGLWADRKNGMDSITLAAELRRKLEQRGDA